MSTLKVDAIKDRSDGNTATINGQTPTASNMMGRNIIINGAMQVAQRGTSTSSVSSGSSNFPVDRTRVQLSNGGTWTISQSSTVPSGKGFSNSIKLDCTTADSSLGASDYLMLQQIVEGQNVQQFAWGSSDANSLTVSFWIRSNKTGTYSLEIQHQNSSNAFYHTSKTFTISVADTWEHKTVTYAGNTAQNIINTNAAGIYVTFWLASGTTYSGGTFSDGTWNQTSGTRVSSSNVNLADNTSNELYLTGLQVELGAVASPFEFESYSTTLAKCERYYQNYVTNKLYFNGTNEPSSEVGNSRILPTQMRTLPTIGNKSSSHGSVGAYSANAQSIRYLTVSSHGSGGFNIGLDLDAEI